MTRQEIAVACLVELLRQGGSGGSVTDLAVSAFNYADAFLSAEKLKPMDYCFSQGDDDCPCRDCSEGT